MTMDDSLMPGEGERPETLEEKHIPGAGGEDMDDPAQDTETTKSLPWHPSRRRQSLFFILKAIVLLGLVAGFAYALRTVQIMTMGQVKGETAATQQIMMVQHIVSTRFTAGDYSAITLKEVLETGEIPQRMIIGDKLPGVLGGHIDIRPEDSGTAYSIVAGPLESDACEELASTDVGATPVRTFVTTPVAIITSVGTSFQSKDAKSACQTGGAPYYVGWVYH